MQSPGGAVAPRWSGSAQVEGAQHTEHKGTYVQLAAGPEEAAKASGPQAMAGPDGDTAPLSVARRQASDSRHNSLGATTLSSHHLFSLRLRVAGRWAGRIAPGDRESPRDCPRPASC